MVDDRPERPSARQLGECRDVDIAGQVRALALRADTARDNASSDVPALDTLGDETRYTIVRLLAGADRELCVCELEAVVDVSDSAVSHALADLRDAGLVTRRKDGTWRYYAATPRARALLGALDDTRSRGVSETVRVALVCVQNAGRSQMAAAFAERERGRRGLDDRVEILTGGTDPADHVHDEVVDVMAEVGIDLSERQPREITTDQLRSSDYVATMGCSTLDVSQARDAVDVRDWALPDPDGADPDRVREIRDTVRDRVTALFDDIEQS